MNHIFYTTKRSYKISACNLTIRTKNAFFSLQNDYYARLYLLRSSYRGWRMECGIVGLWECGIVGMCYCVNALIRFTN